MSSTQDALNDKEKTAIRWLAGGNRSWIGRDYFRHQTDLSNAEVQRLERILTKREAIEIDTGKDPPYEYKFRVLSPIDDFVTEFDGIPPRDLPQGVWQWLKSKWWFLPFSIFFTILGSLTVLIASLKLLLEWFGLL